MYIALQCETFVINVGASPAKPGIFTHVQMKEVLMVRDDYHLLTKTFRDIAKDSDTYADFEIIAFLPKTLGHFQGIGHLHYEDLAIIAFCMRHSSILPKTRTKANAESVFG